MGDSEAANNTSEHKQIPVWKNASFRHIAVLMAIFSMFYYMDVIINYAGWTNLRWGIFYTVHDLHRAFFLIPVMYAAYAFRVKGTLMASAVSFLIFLPRALFISPYPDPLVRAVIFIISMMIMGVFLSLLLENMNKRKELEQSLWRTQNDLKRIQVEESLRETEDKYKRLIDNIPDIIFTIDLEGRITFISKKTNEILGYENAETINMNIFNFIPEEDRQRAMENLQKGMKGEKIRHFQIPLMAKSGERLIFECSFSRVYKDGKVVGAQGTAVDITERKRIDDALRINEERYRMAEAIGHVGNWEYNIQSTKFWGSDEAKRIYGFAPNALDFPADEVESCIPERERVHQALVDLIEAGKPYNLEFEIHPRNSSKPKIIASIAELQKDKDGNPLMVRGVIQDITKRKLAEAEQALNSQRMQAMLQLNRMSDSTLKEITDFALEEAVRLTQSRIGYLAFLNEDESVLTMHSWSKSAMAQCAISDKPIIYPVVSTGLWGEAVRQRRPVITNDYAADNPLKKGYPPGHVALTRHMNIPVFSGNRIVLVAGVGNKNEDYDQSDVEQLTLLMEGMWRLIERKQAEEELRGLTDRLNLALETANAGTWDWDVVSKDIEWSSQMFDLFGLDQSRNTASFATWKSILHPEDLEMAGSRINQALANHESLNSDYRIVRPDGEIRWINATGKGKYDERGQPVRMQGICMDITDRKIAEFQKEALLEEIKKMNEELERHVAERTAQLTAKTSELEKLNKVFVDRELRMRELKERIEELEKQKT